MSQFLDFAIYNRAREVESDPREWEAFEADMRDSDGPAIATLFPDGRV